MKKSILMMIVAASIVFTSVSLFAYWGQGPNGNSKYNKNSRGGYGMMNEYYLKDELKLSDKQFNSIQKLNDEYREKMYKLRGDRDKIIDLRDEYVKDVKKVLNSDQKKRYDELYNNGSVNCPCYR